MKPREPRSFSPLPLSLIMLVPDSGHEVSSARHATPRSGHPTLMTPAQRRALKAVAEGPQPLLTADVARQLYGEPLTRQRFSAAAHLIWGLSEQGFLIYEDGWRTTAEGDRVVQRARRSPRLRWRRAGRHPPQSKQHQLWLDRKFLCALVFDLGHEAFGWRVYSPTESLPSNTTPRHKEGEERSLTAAREVATAVVLAYLELSDTNFKSLAPREAKAPAPPRRP
jgi:hypothetical protein